MISRKFLLGYISSKNSLWSTLELSFPPPKPQTLFAPMSFSYDPVVVTITRRWVTRENNENGHEYFLEYCTKKKKTVFIRRSR